MLVRTPEPHWKRLARLKLELDGPARMAYAFEEGLRLAREELRRTGLQEGILVGQIATYEKALGIPQTPMDELFIYSELRKKERLEQLRTQYESQAK